MSGVKDLAKMLVWPLKEKEIKRVLKTIRAQKATCDLALNADNT